MMPAVLICAAILTATIGGLIAVHYAELPAAGRHVIRPVIIREAPVKVTIRSDAPALDILARVRDRLRELPAPAAATFTPADPGDTITDMPAAELAVTR